MKKDSQKKNSRKQSQNDGLNDFGLEPPKIYRDSQKRITRQSDVARKSTKRTEPTRHERRQRETAKRKTKNKLRQIFVWFLVAIMVVATAAVLSLTVFFNIEKITVNGNERYTEEEILTQCTVDVGENLFLADKKQAIRILEKNLPYIYTAKLKIKLPSSIQINIVEATPAYYIQNKDKTYILLDDNFKVLENSSKKKQGIKISKAEIKSAVAGQRLELKNSDNLDCLVKLSTAIKTNDIKEITEIYCKNISDNYVVYDNRIEFKLGTCENLDNKLMQGLASCEKLNQTSPNAKGTMTINGGKQIYFTEK